MPKATESPAGRHLVFTTRTVLYGLAFGLIFAMTCAELGLVSEQLHKYGNDYTHYGSKQYKHVLGMLLFSVIASLLVMLAHPFVGVPFIAFWSFILAVFFGTSAGVIQRNTPFFKGTGCRPADEIPESWRPYVHECSRIVTIQALAWALWGAYIFLFIGTLCHKLKVTTRPTPEGFYYNKV